MNLESKSIINDSAVVEKHDDVKPPQTIRSSNDDCELIESLNKTDEINVCNNDDDENDSKFSEK